MKDYKLTESNSIALDLVRGISAQLVVVGHGFSFFGVFKSLQQPNFPWIQNIAVLIFFILSGFLITYSTLRKTDYNFKYFLADRFSRIYTAFIPALFFVLVIDFISKILSPKEYAYESAYSLQSFIGNLFMFQDFPLFKGIFNLPVITSFGSSRVLWTLAVEWWIYLFFGYLFLVVFKKRLNYMNILVLGFFAIVPAFNFIDGRGDGLTLFWIFGALVYYFASKNVLQNIRKPIIIALFFSFVILASLRIYITMNEYETIFAFSLAVLLLLLLNLTKDIKFSLFWIKTIKLIASYSYTLYLVHYSILSFIVIYFKDGYNPYFLFVLGFMLSNVISFMIGYYTENKLTRKVKKYLYSKINKI